LVMGLGPQSPIPNPQSPIPNPHLYLLIEHTIINIKIFFNYNYNLKYLKK